jgi:hypothetical protein
VNESSAGQRSKGLSSNATRFRMQRPTFDSIVGVIGPITIAVLLFWFFFLKEPLQPASGPTPLDVITQELTNLCPEDPALATRTATQWLYVAQQVGREEGCDGLRTLDWFGDDAVYLFESNRTSFRDLKAVMSLEGALFAATTGPWRKAVIEWAMSGRLHFFLKYLDGLTPEERAQLRAVPGCLPLLGQQAPTAKTMLAKYGARAWHLFMLVDFVDTGSEGIERVAHALNLNGEPMLDLNERFGLATALLLVPSADDLKDQLPSLFRHAIDMLGPEEAAALFVSNHDDLAALLPKDQRPLDELVEAVDILSDQPQVRALATDSSHSFRLILEKRGAEHTGLRILRRCGPDAADLLFEPGGYAGHPDDREAALIIMSREGRPGLEILRELHGWDPWHKLLRRKELRESTKDPLLGKIVRKLACSPARQDEIESLLQMPLSQIETRQYPPSQVEKALEWIPGYLAARALRDASKGFYLDRTEIGWALFDGAMTASMIGGLTAEAVKTVGRGAAKEAMEEIGRQATRELAEQSTKQATRTLLMRLPGAAVAYFKALPRQALTADITQIMKTTSAVAKRIGVRTWGKLDRRIIMRGDRRVLIDLTNPDFLAKIGEDVRGQLVWGAVALSVNEVGPCIMERVTPSLRLNEE